MKQIKTPSNWGPNRIPKSQKQTKEAKPLLVVNILMRNDQWLLFRLEEIWRNYFVDVPQVNPVTISFGRSALYRFGSIRLNLATGKSQILINGQFRDPKFPQEVVDHTIAHELAHYSLGFSSPNPRLHRYPHRGGVIDKELKKRGLSALVLYYKQWVKDYVKNLP